MPVLLTTSIVVLAILSIAGVTLWYLRAWLRNVWIFIVELGQVAFACRFAVIVTVVCAILLVAADPAQDMVVEAIFESIAKDGDRWNVLRIVASVFAWSWSAWYCARVSLRFTFMLPAIGSEDTWAEKRAIYRIWCVRWFPRLLGGSAIASLSLCLAGAALSDGDAATLGIASLIFAVAAIVFVSVVYARQFVAARIVPRSAATGDASVADKAPWAIGPAGDPRAPYASVHGTTGVTHRSTRMAFAVLLLIAPLLIAVGTLSPVVLGNLLGGLGVALTAAAFIMPVGTYVAVQSSHKRVPLLAGLVLLAVVMPYINVAWGPADNHALRTCPIADTCVAERREEVPGYLRWLGRGPVPPKTAPWQGRQDIAGDPRAQFNAVYEAWRDAQSKALNHDRPPMVIIAAEGGASRSAYWTAMVLSELTRREPHFRDSVFAISSVSGGSLGAALYRRLVDVDRDIASAGDMAVGKWCGTPPGRGETTLAQRRPDWYAECVRAFMSRDFLAATFAGALYPDLTQRFLPMLPGLFQMPDRAMALEAAWEAAWLEQMNALIVANATTASFSSGLVVDTGLRRDLRSSFGNQRSQRRAWPILLMNSTSVETGRRIVFSNVDAVSAVSLTTGDKTLMPCITYNRDVEKNQAFYKKARQNHKGAECSIWEKPDIIDAIDELRADVPLSSAVSASSRFPYIGPAAGLVTSSGYRFGHAVDGGYYENYGAGTAADVIDHILRFKAIGLNFRALVILISNDPDMDGLQQVHAEYGDIVGRKENHHRPTRPDCTLDEATGLCTRDSMTAANEIKAPLAALYRTRSGRGEQEMQRLRTSLVANTYLDKNFFHFRHCKVDGRKAASMTWYVSKQSRDVMDSMLPPQGADLTRPELNDPCGNGVEMQRFIERFRCVLRREC